MDTKKHPNKKTAHGVVSRKALRKLKDSFDTAKILNAIGLLDSIGSRCEPGENAIRNDFFRLHSMAHELCNGGVGTCAPKPNETIYELAHDLLDEISDWSLALRQTERLLEKLVALTPDDD